MAICRAGSWRAKRTEVACRRAKELTWNWKSFGPNGAGIPASRKDMSFSVILADLGNPSHQSAIIDLLDMYCRDEFGDEKPLSADARANLIPGLIKHGG